MQSQIPPPTPTDTVYRKYVTAQLLRNLPIYNWFIYPHSFAKELVLDLIGKFSLRKGSEVGDIFVGAGTTMLTCKQAGINSWGYDILPLSVMIANTKVATYSVRELETTWMSIKADASSQVSPMDIPLLNRAFSPAVRGRLQGIYNELQQKIRNTNVRNFFHLALLHILEDVSHTKKSGGWLSIISEGDTGLSVEAVTERFRSQVQAMIGDLSVSDNESVTNGKWQAFVRDARSYRNNVQADAIITSPPYLNRHDYTRVFALELAMGFVKSQAEIKPLRYTSLRSHPEAKVPTNVSLRGYQSPELLSKIKADLPNEKRSCDDRIHKMIDGYFEDMYLVLRAAKRQIRKNGHIAFVIGNVRFGGVVIPVDEIVAMIGEMVGLRCTEILVARERGNSAQQMRDYGKEKSRESIVIWHLP